LQETSPENKLRLLMIYAAVYPEKFEGDKGVKLMQVFAHLSLIIDITMISSLRYFATKFQISLLLFRKY